MGKERIRIPIINLKWSRWHRWNDLKHDARSKENNSVNIPKIPGVYEAKYKNKKKRLTIGKTNKLHGRIRKLIKGERHSTGKRMKLENVKFSKVVVRWAVTDRPSAVEEALHKKHEQKYGKLPQYVKNT